MKLIAKLIIAYFVLKWLFKDDCPDEVKETISFLKEKVGQQWKQ